jgi:segregation and condensation protein B
VSEQQILPAVMPDAEQRRALLEAIIFASEEPLSAAQIAKGLHVPVEQVEADLAALVEECAQPGRGIEVRLVAQGYRVSTKPEHHEAVRTFVKTLRPKLKLSLPALETLAVIAYRQPVTIPEVQAVRGVSAAGVIHTLLDRKLIAPAGRKKVIGRPMQYKTTKEFLVHFGLNDLSELPTLKELEELARSALGEDLVTAAETEAPDEPRNETPEPDAPPDPDDSLERDAPPKPAESVDLAEAPESDTPEPDTAPEPAAAGESAEGPEAPSEPAETSEPAS